MSETVEFLAFRRGAARFAVRSRMVERVDRFDGEAVVVARTNDDEDAISFVAEDVKLVEAPVSGVLSLPRLARASVQESFDALVINPEVFLVLSARGVERIP